VTVKVPPKGTRGLPFPAFLVRFGNRFEVRRFRTGGPRTQAGLPILLLETTGARSDKPRHAPIGYLQEGPGAWLIIASLAGAARQPAWLYNLAKQPSATIEFNDGSRIPVLAESLEGRALEEAWARIEIDAPAYADYRSKTDREIPVLRLRQR
jgi:deazaflavin-dependent oxidoreductase (nitroreductase family)